MSLRTNIIFPMVKKNWKLLAQEIQATFVEGGFWDSDKVVLSYRNTTILLDARNALKKYQYIRTRIICPFISTNEFQFSISLENAFTFAGKVFGINDIEIGDKKWDNEFYLKSNDKDKLNNFLSSNIIRKYYFDIANYETGGIGIKVTNNHPFFSLQSISPYTSWIVLEREGGIADNETLKSWFNLCKITLDRLIEIGETEDIDPNIQYF